MRQSNPTAATKSDAVGAPTTNGDRNTQPALYWSPRQQALAFNVLKKTAPVSALARAAA